MATLRVLSEAVEDFRGAMAATGITWTGQIIADGKLRRVKVEGDRARNSWYVLHPGPPFAAGAFGCWKRALKETWSDRNGSSLSEFEQQHARECWESAKRARERFERARREKAQKTGGWILNRSRPARNLHRYLVHKCVKVFGELREYRGALVLPLRDENRELHSLQFIAGASKKFLTGGRVAGCFYTLADKGDGPLIIVEGYATGASIHEATGLATIAAIDAGNLLTVAKALREKFPAREIIIAADNDQFTEGNAGLTKATAAAKAIGGKLAVPRFADLSNKPTDFNDLAVLAGLAEVERQIQKAAIPSDVPSNAEAERSPVSRDDFYAYMPMHNYIFVPARDFWPASSVNARIKPVPLKKRDGEPVLDENGKQKFVSASAWLDRNRAVEQITWAPGKPMLINDRLISEGGWIERRGCKTFNLYRPPNIKPGDATNAGRWLDHVATLYPDHKDHIVRWLASRVQHPDVKINHALFLGGDQGIGKDSLLFPVKQTVGQWNVQEILPPTLLGRFNGFVKSVLLCIDEAHDLGEVDRYTLYERVKAYTAAPPDVIRVDEKNLREYAVFNMVGLIIISNYKAGLYLHSDDRRHYVAWSELKKDDFSEEYWMQLYAWYDRGGCRHVAAYLAELDISDFNPKAPPKKTDAFWEIVDSNRAPENAELADALEYLGNPDLVTIAEVVETQFVDVITSDLADWLKDPRNGRRIFHRFEDCGYVPVRNPDHHGEGRWMIGKKRCVIYAKKTLSKRDQLAGAREKSEAGRQ